MITARMKSKVVRAIQAPFLDTVRGLEHCLGDGVPALFKVLLGLILGWWIYVPLHELLHAFGCLATGGEVTHLEIDALYGGALLARLFPFVQVGSDYAGQLTGFSTGGSDLVYLATDLAPFLLSLWPGVWLMRLAARRARPILYGASLPAALGPFLSATGDAYEMGSIVTTRLPAWAGEVARDAVRGDDLFLVPEAIALAASEQGGSPVVLWMAMVLAAALGLVWCFAWWQLSSWAASRLAQPPLEPVERRAPASTEGSQLPEG